MSKAQQLLVDTAEPIPVVFVMGGGAVATTLAGSLRRAGAPVLGLWARNPTQARRAAAASGVVGYGGAIPDIISQSKVVIVAVADRAIKQVSSMLLATGVVTKHHVFVHCSGAQSCREVFSTVSHAVGGMATMHPIRAIRAKQPIADIRRGKKTFSQTVFGVEGTAQAVASVTALVRLLGGSSLILDTVSSGDNSVMVKYHAACSISANYLVTLFAQSQRLFRRLGIDDGVSVKALRSLMQGSLDNVNRLGVAQGLTGPIVRGDRATVEAHWEALQQYPDIRETYRVLGLTTCDLARDVAKDTEDKELLANVIDIQTLLFEV